MEKNSGDMMELLKDEPVQCYKKIHAIQEIHINLNSAIKEPYHYGDIIQQIRDTDASDSIHLHINSPGGHLDSTIELIYNLQKSPATIVGYLGSDASSAGSMIFLACDAWVIHDLSTMMIHAPSAGTIGTMPNMIAYTDQLKELSRRVMEQYYTGFLTDEEIQAICEGKPDMYLFAEDIEERLNNLQEYRYQLAMEEEDEYEDSEEYELSLIDELDEEEETEDE